MPNLLHREIQGRRAKTAFVCVLVFAGALVALALGGAIGQWRGGGVVYPHGEPLYLLGVNTADAGALEMLPEIGPKLAAKIIAERERGGAFRDAADLERVNGIGPKTSDRLRAYLSFDEPGEE